MLLLFFYHLIKVLVKILLQTQSYFLFFKGCTKLLEKAHQQSSNTTAFFCVEKMDSVEQDYFDEMIEENSKSITLTQHGPYDCPHFQGWCVVHESPMEDESLCSQVYDDIEPTEAELGYVGVSPLDWIQLEDHSEPEPHTEE